MISKKLKNNTLFFARILFVLLTLLGTGALTSRAEPDDLKKAPPSGKQEPGGPTAPGSVTPADQTAPDLSPEPSPDSAIPEARPDEEEFDEERVRQTDRLFCWPFPWPTTFEDQAPSFDSFVLECARSFEMARKSWKYSSEGTKLAMDGNLKKALALYTRAIEADPSLAWNYARRGQILLAGNQIEAALKDFTRAVELDPEYVWAYAKRGNIWVEKRDWAKSIADFNRAIELDPDYAWAYYARSFPAMFTGDITRAVADLRQAVKLEPGEPTFAQRLEDLAPPRKKGRLYIKTDPVGARVMIMNIVPRFHQGIELSPGKYHIRVKARGFDSIDRWIELEAGENRQEIFVLPDVRAMKPKLENQ